MTNFKQQKLITRLSTKAAKQLKRQFPHLPMTRNQLQSYLADEMWTEPDAITYTVAVKKLPNYQIAIVVLPVYKDTPLPKSKKYFGI